MNRLPFFLIVVSFYLLMGCQPGSQKKVVPPNLSEAVEAYNPDLIHEGLVLAVEGGGTTAYLLDKAGKKHHTWTFDAGLGNDVKLLPNGKMLGIFKTDSAAFKFAGGYGGIVRLINPDNSVDWEYKYSTADYLSHHDVATLPNGNVMFLVWEKITKDEARKAGANVMYDVYTEKVVEVNPATNEVVWEWRSWNHIVQDFDANLPNYGAISEHPHKININYALKDNGDVMHANGLEYDADRDVIYISVNYFSEIWVVDHSTTTAEATSGSGGKYSKGGDLLYRFGNPEAYGNSEGQRLFDRVHFPNLLEEGVPGAGNMLVYVNGLSSKLSTVYEFSLPDDFSLKVNGDNELPVVWSFSDSTLFYGRISGADRLSNGNTLICEGDYGFWEVTPDGEVAWKYKDTGRTFWRGYAFDWQDEPIRKLGLKKGELAE